MVGVCDSFTSEELIRGLWQPRRRKSSSVPVGAANFPAAVFLAGKCPNLGSTLIFHSLVFAFSLVFGFPFFSLVFAFFSLVFAVFPWCFFPWCLVCFSLVFVGPCFFGVCLSLLVYGATCMQALCCRFADLSLHLHSLSLFESFDHLALRGPCLLRHVIFLFFHMCRPHGMNFVSGILQLQQLNSKFQLLKPKQLCWILYCGGWVVLVGLVWLKANKTKTIRSSQSNNSHALNLGACWQSKLRPQHGCLACSYLCVSNWIHAGNRR